MKTRPTFSFGGGKEMAGRNTRECFSLAQEIQDVYKTFCESNFSDEEKAKLTADLKKKAKQIKLAVKAPAWFAALFH